MKKHNEEIDSLQHIISRSRSASFHQYVQSLDWAIGKTKHNQSFNSFLRAATLGIAPEEAMKAVLERIEASNGILDRSQPERQQARAYEHVTERKLETAGHLSVATTRKPKIAFRPDVLRCIADGVTITDPIGLLKTRSAYKPEDVTSEKFLNLLYHPGEIVVVFTIFKSQGQALYAVGQAPATKLPAGGEDGVWFLTNSIDGDYHPNPREQGKPSRRSEESVTSWRHLVLESDVADAADWIRVLVQMPLRIVAIYSSGGKSIHALVRIDAESKADWDQKVATMKPTLVMLGADPGAMTAVRLSRLPQCWRGQKRQELYYINPAADGTPIIAMPQPCEPLLPHVGTVREEGC